jgi:thymidylate synthase
VHTNYIQSVRETFIALKDLRSFAPNGTLEIKNASFVVDAPTIFGSRNEEYIAAEIAWYESQSRIVCDLFEIYGKPVKIWQDVADYNNRINSNYGWCIYSPENGLQYNNVLCELSENPTSRRAAMYYTRPSMHGDAVNKDGNDHMCTYAVHYTISDNGMCLEASVMMRSNDAVFGFTNDVAWQKHVQLKLADELGLHIGPIHWFANSLHVYPRHFHLVPAMNIISER